MPYCDDYYFIEPSEFLLNDLFLWGDSSRTPSLFDPPLDKALTCATSFHCDRHLWHQVFFWLVGAPSGQATHLCLFVVHTLFYMVSVYLHTAWLASFMKVTSCHRTPAAQGCRVWVPYVIFVRSIHPLQVWLERIPQRGDLLSGVFLSDKSVVHDEQ